VGGNGGIKPQHAILLAEDLDEATVIRYLDRFLMFYIRTADRLQRTATWLNNLEGGIEYLKEVIIEDSLGIGEELEREMAHLVATYQCEWKTTIQNEDSLKRFRSFVNSPQVDPNIVFVEERGQKRPAYTDEKPMLIPAELVMPIG
jgi:nitrite reductase (NADH) large subunit